MQVLARKMACLQWEVFFEKEKVQTADNGFGQGFYYYCNAFTKFFVETLFLSEIDIT